jgi:hypothetical protein
MQEALGRLAKHLPAVGEGGALGRFVRDAEGWVWVTEDISPIILLKGHLIVEATLIDICSRSLPNPAGLEKENVSFRMRLSLVQALTDDGVVPQAIWDALQDLNRIRNKLAHNLEPKALDSELRQFLQRFDEFVDFRPLNDEQDALPSRLIGCLAFLCGALSGIGKPVTSHESVGA